MREILSFRINKKSIAVQALLFIVFIAVGKTLEHPSSTLR